MITKVLEKELPIQRDIYLKRDISFLSLIRPSNEEYLYTLAVYTAEIVMGLGVIMETEYQKLL